MDKIKLAKAISIVLYPGITGALFTFILYFAVIGLNLRAFLITLVYSVLITLVPFLIIKFLQERGKVADREISIKEERKIFWKTSFPSYLLALLFLFLVKVPSVLLLMGAAVMLFVISYSLINRYYKISVHVGGLTFDIVALSLVLDNRFLILLSLLVPLTWSRYQLKRHTLGESFGGALVGALIPWLMYSLFF